MALKLYNWLTKQKEEFIPLQQGCAGLYVCGPTVYGHAHIGHAKAYLTYDILHRYLEYRGFKVRYVQNITDVGHLADDADTGEDKIEKKANLDRVEPMEIAEYYTRSFYRDMDALNILPPDIAPRASGHIPEQIELAEILIKNGYAYASGGSVYFSVKKWPDYGRLSGRKIDQLAGSERLSADSYKRDPRDFAVWRAAKPGQIMRWRSPWGEGIPGWHAECTVMSRKYLDLPFDIHGGGLENIFPHNESEMAQCEAAFNRKYAQYWVLNNMVTVDGIKMGKSLGNFTTVREALKEHSPMSIRFFILNSHYRSNTDFSYQAIDAAARGYTRLQGTLDRIRQVFPGKAAPVDLDSIPRNISFLIRETEAAFSRAMDDDLNTPAALSILFDFSRKVNDWLADRGGKKPDPAVCLALAKVFKDLGGDVLGLFAGDSQAAGQLSDLAGKLIDLLVGIRTRARNMKDWQQSDRIRDDLAELGVTLEDRADGSTGWQLE